MFNNNYFNISFNNSIIELVREFKEFTKDDTIKLKIEFSLALKEHKSIDSIEVELTGKDVNFKCNGTENAVYKELCDYIKHYTNIKKELTINGKKYRLVQID